MNFIYDLTLLSVPVTIITVVGIVIYYVDKGVQWLEIKYNEMMDMRDYLNECIERKMKND